MEMPFVLQADIRYRQLFSICMLSLADILRCSMEICISAERTAVLAMLICRQMICFISGKNSCKHKLKTAAVNIEVNYILIDHILIGIAI